MSRYARLVLIEFRSAENFDFLYRAILEKFSNSAEVANYLRDNLGPAIVNSAAAYEHEMLNATPLPGITIYEQLKSLNQQFAADQIRFIRTYIIGEAPPKYAVSDGCISATRRPSECTKVADGKPGIASLGDWWWDSSNGSTTRDDHQGDVNWSSYYGAPGRGPCIEFCDQRDINNSYDIEAFNSDFGHRSLNGPKLWGNAFGVPSPENDARLMTRQIFRKDERGLENGIPYYERRLYNRAYERDVDETLRQGEMGTILSGYDMRSLHRRVNQRRSFAAKHGGGNHTDYSNRYS